jgi:hypothetical protein
MKKLWIVVLGLGVLGLYYYQFRSLEKVSPSQVAATDDKSGAATSGIKTEGAASGRPDQPTHPDQSGDPARITLSEFHELAETTLEHLPKVSDLRKLSAEEVHHTPQIVTQASLQIGKIAQAIHDHPELAEDGASFYRQCATQSDGATSIRALCFAQFRNLETHLGKEVDTSGVTEAILNLAKNIPVEEP